jgi:hypothetical protein
LFTGNVALVYQARIGYSAVMAARDERRGASLREHGEPRRSSTVDCSVVAATLTVGGAAFAMHAAPHRSAAINRAVRSATREPRPSACMRPRALSAIIVGG